MVVSLHELSDPRDIKIKRLSALGKEHAGLANEYGKKETTPERKDQILNRIDEIRSERHEILQQL